MHGGVVGPVTRSKKPATESKGLESPAIEGDSPVGDIQLAPMGTLSTAGHVKSRGNLRGPSRKAKYSLATDSEPVP